MILKYFVLWAAKIIVMCLGLHGTRSFGLNCEWSVTANGWGTQAENRIIDKFSFSWTAQSPLINIKQMPNSSIETVFLRVGRDMIFHTIKRLHHLLKLSLSQLWDNLLNQFNIIRHLYQYQFCRNCKSSRHSCCSI